MAPTATSAAGTRKNHYIHVLDAFLLSAALSILKHEGFLKWGKFIQQAARIGLKPSEFWHLTPREVWEQIDAFNWRNERQRERDAWLAMHFLAPWSKEPITVDQLLGREPQMTLDEKLAAWAELLEDDRLKSGKGQDA